MTGFQPGRMGGHALPDDAPAFTTLVHLTWEEGRIEHRIRFGRTIYQRKIDRRSRVVGFAPNSVFAFVRWASNDYGTVVSRIDILRAIGRGEPFQTLPFVRPGGDLLLKLHGWPKVERVLQLIDAIDALGHLRAQLPRSRHPSDREAFRPPRNPHPHELPARWSCRRLVRGIRCGRRSLPALRPSLHRLRDRPDDGRPRP